MLTKKQADLLEYIIAFRDKKGYPPALLEMCEHFGWGSSRSASDHVRALEKKGYISRTHRHRDIQILKGGMS
jgi:repressor LexA